MLTVLVFVLPVAPPSTTTSSSHLVALSSSTASWAKLSLTTHPSNRSGLGLAYDTKDGYLLEFGGYADRGRLLNQTWTFASGNWTELFPAVSPPSEYRVILGYDNATGQAIYYGGESVHSTGRGGHYATFLGETWSFSAGVWTQLHPAVSPPPNFVPQSIAYDGPAHALVMVGSRPCPNRINLTTCAPSKRVTATWEWKGSNWHLAGADTSGPFLVGIAFDPAYRTLVGEGYPNWTQSSVDTYSLLAGNWTPMNVTVQLPLFVANQDGEAYQYSAQTQSLLLVTRSTAGFQRAEQVWSFWGGAWHERPDGHGALPRARADFGLAFDPQGGYLVEFGGTANYGLEFNQTWTY
jgi:hypothetical protein